MTVARQRNHPLSGGVMLRITRTARLWLTRSPFSRSSAVTLGAGAVAEHGEQDVDAPASEAEEGSGVCVLNAKGVCL